MNNKEFNTKAVKINFKTVVIQKRRYGKVFSWRLVYLPTEMSDVIN